MQEQGKVTKLNGNIATVSIDKKTECDKCGMCLFPNGAKAVEFETENTLSASVGDVVLIQRQEKGKLTAIILVFLVPLLLILLSSLVAIFIIQSELWMLWLSLITLVLWFCVLPLIDKRLKKTQGFTTEMISIIAKCDKEKQDE
jgi:positive regulator of sigma E activity